MIRCAIYGRFSLALKSVVEREIVRTMSTVDTTVKNHEKSDIFVDDKSSSDRRMGLSLREQNKLRKKKPISYSDSRLLKVAIIGTPNAGKSTLSNKLIGWKFAPVSQKVHTTRQKTLGVLTEENKQVVFLDTPGVITPHKKKQHNLENSLLIDPHLAVMEADLLAVVIDISHIWHRTKIDTEILKILHFHPDKKSILILNKVDLVKEKRELLGIARTLTDGIVGGTKSWTTSKKPHKTDLNLLFEKMKLYKENSKASNERVAEKVTVPEEQQELKTEEICQFQDEDGTAITTYNSSKHLTDSDGENNSEPQPSEEHDSKTNDFPDLRDTDVWKLYYQKMQKLCGDLEDKKGWPHFDRVFMISALSGDGIYDLKEYLLNETYSSEMHYHPSVVTNQDPLALARLCVFERLLDHLPDEIPYQVKMKLSLWEVTEDNLLRVSFDLTCSKKRHLRHLLGKNGETIKAIAAEAKQQLMNAFRRELSLRLIVKGAEGIYKPNI